MSSIYLVGTAGPWYADDTLVRSDGALGSDLVLVHQPTVDGVTGPRRTRSGRVRGDGDDVFLGRVVRETDRAGGLDRR